MGEKPLTWQQVLAVLCVIGMLPAGIFAWGGNIPDAYRPLGALAFWCLVALFVGLLVWHYKRVSRKDLRSDFLAQLFPIAQLLQAGPVQLWLGMAQNGPQFRIIIVAQNTRDGIADLKFKFKAERFRALGLTTRSALFASAPTPLDCVLPGGGLAIAWIDLCVLPLSKQAKIRFGLDASGAASGNEVRFARRRAITRPTSGWLTLFSLLGGHIHTGGGTFFKTVLLPCDPVSPEAVSTTAQDWSIRTLWSPEQETPLEQIAENIEAISSLTAQPPA